MPRIRSQLAIQAPPELIERVKAAAAAQGRTSTSVVLEWIEAGLGRPGHQRLPSDLAARVAALEAAVAALRRHPSSGVRSIPQAGELAKDEPSTDQVTTLPPVEGAISSSELAERLQMKRGTFIARLNRQGGARAGLVVDGWVCLGVSRSPTGGPPRATWRPAGDT
jgi:predicted DNA-binding protein